jgi:glycerate kinase
MMANPKNVLVAMSGFKGSLTNIEACQCVASALKDLNLAHSIVPIGDGGKGTGLALNLALGGEFHSIDSIDPLGRPISGTLLCFPNSKSPSRIYIESSSVCGYTLIKKEEKNALQASSRGLGIMLRESILRWKHSLQEIWIGLGDSAISDMGMGMLSELGVHFLNSKQEPIPATTDHLVHINAFSPPSLHLNSISLTVLCDVSNPVCGPQGSAVTFSPQKGATPEQVALIARGMENFATRIENKLHRSLKYIPMTGSAGGLSAALFSFFNAKLVPGCEFLLSEIGFDEKISQHDWVVTGEGRTDAQTLKGKAPAVVFEHSRKQNKQCLFISGSLGEGLDPISKEGGMVGVYACGREPSAKEALTRKTREVFSQFKSSF